MSYIRNVELSDAEVLVEIYRPYVENTAISFECETPSVDEFRSRIENISKKYPYIVMLYDDEIVGYAYAGRFKGRKAYDWCVETTIYVREDKKDGGYGKKLYLELEKRLKKQNILNMYACIAYTDNEDEHLTNNSMQFHEHMGFRLIGTFKKCGYKFDKWYDMIWMEKFIGEHKVNPDAVTRPEI